jgi:tellurite resistance protein TehA-like permease
MGTAIVSLALALDGERSLSRALMWMALATWVVLTASAALHLVTGRGVFISQLRLPASLSGVAGTCVIGARLVLYGWTGPGAMLLILATLLWVGLLPAILRNWTTPTVGTSFLLAVSTFALCGLAEELATAEGTAWLAWAGLPLLVAGAAAYVFVASGFDFSQLLRGSGDQWVAGGALAIGGLCLAELLASSHRFTGIASLEGVLTVAGWVVWVAAIVWLPLLVLGEVIRPRPEAHPHRWATVFPIGMYAAMSFALGAQLRAPALVDFARVWVWVAVAVWALVVIGTARRLRRGAGSAGGYSSFSSEPL